MGKRPKSSTFNDAATRISVEVLVIGSKCKFGPSHGAIEQGLRTVGFSW